MIHRSSKIIDKFNIFKGVKAFGLCNLTTVFKNMNHSTQKAIILFFTRNTIYLNLKVILAIEHLCH